MVDVIHLKEMIAQVAAGSGPITIMEVCGTHTSRIFRYGIRELLPSNTKLVSGPGCPVCVTAQEDISAALTVANRDDVIFTCFGDMMRVPYGESSLYSLYESGRDIRIVTSPMDALRIAQLNPAKQVVYFGVGFETTAPLTAALIEKADALKFENLSVMSTHKTMPAAIEQLLSEGSGIAALLCPGHVAVITGSDEFGFIPERLGLPAVVAGFEAEEIMAALYAAVSMVVKGKLECVNMYPGAVASKGNKDALDLLYKVFEPGDAVWRGFGHITDSGLKIKSEYEKYDTFKRFNLPLSDLKDNVEESSLCICADILRGQSTPGDCPYFGVVCTPERPVGACMVSAEGTCSTYYRYGGVVKDAR